MAILLVVLHHAHIGLTGGYVGVDVFFVISGFLIARQLVCGDMAKGTISFTGFFARGARRILPAATVTTIVTVVAAGLLLSPLPALRVFSDARAAALFGANVHFGAQDADYFNDSLTTSPSSTTSGRPWYLWHWSVLILSRPAWTLTL